MRPCLRTPAASLPQSAQTTIPTLLLACAVARLPLRCSLGSTCAAQWKPEDIILFGYSIGTGPCTHLAAHQRVGGLVLVAPYTSIRDMVQCVLPKVGKVAQYLISNRFDNRTEIRSVTCPTLIIHGRADQLIPFSHSQALHDACPAERKLLYLAQEMDHCYNEEDFVAYILFPLVDFFAIKKHVAPPLFLPEYILARWEPLHEKDRGRRALTRNDHAGRLRRSRRAKAPASCRRRRRPQLRCARRLRDVTTPLLTGASRAQDGKAVDEPDDEEDGGGDDDDEEALRRTEALPDDRWECAVCTFINEPGVRACEVCPPCAVR
jgi:hypothetical protein